MSIDNTLKQHGAFWAFSNEQFNEQKQEGVEYCNAGLGLVCPIDNVKQLKIDWELFAKQTIENDKKENTTEEIIMRELSNYETQISRDIDDTVNALNGYDISRDEVHRVFKEVYMPHCIEHDLF